MTDERFAQLISYWKQGLQLIATPDEKQEFEARLAGMGIDVTPQVERMRVSFSVIAGCEETELPLPPKDIGFPVVGLYEGIYRSLLAGENYGACVLCAILVEYCLKNLIYARKFGFSGFDWMKWQSEGLDDKQYNDLLNGALPYLNGEEHSLLDQFRKKRNDLVHFNLVKLTTPGELTVTALSNQVVELERRRGSFLPSSAWLMFTKLLSVSVTDLFAEADRLVHLVWNKSKTA